MDVSLPALSQDEDLALVSCQQSITVVRFANTVLLMVVSVDYIASWFVVSHGYTQLGLDLATHNPDWIWSGHVCLCEASFEQYFSTVSLLHDPSGDTPTYSLYSVYLAY